VYGNPNYGFNVVMGSWRLNMLTRGIQDVDLIKQAYAINPSSTTAIVNSIVQDVMYLRGPFDPNDPSYSYGVRPWNESENAYEVARESLLQIISSAVLPTPYCISGNGSISGSGTLYLK